MQNLSVVFPQADPMNPVGPHIDRDIQIAHPEERINWKFYTVDNSIKYVEVEFDSAGFFPGANDPKKYSARLHQGQAIIYGTVPASNQIKEDKYTVRGYDGNPENPGPAPQVLMELDPKIVTAVP